MFGLIVSLLLARGIGKPIREITATMSGFADGDLDLTVPHGERQDEIGIMAGTIEVFRKGLVERRNLEVEEVEQRQVAEQQRLQREEEKRLNEKERRKNMKRKPRRPKNRPWRRKRLPKGSHVWPKAISQCE